MLTDNNQIFRNCFVIIYCHITKVLSQINKCMIFEPNELSITLSTLCLNCASDAQGYTPCKCEGKGPSIGSNVSYDIVRS